MTDIDPAAREFFDALNHALDTGATVPVTEDDAEKLAEIGAALIEQGYAAVPTADGSSIVIEAPDGRSFTYQRV